MPVLMSSTVGSFLAVLSVRLFGASAEARARSETVIARSEFAVPTRSARCTAPGSRFHTVVALPAARRHSSTSRPASLLLLDCFFASAGHSLVPCFAHMEAARVAALLHSCRYASLRVAGGPLTPGDTARIFVRAQVRAARFATSDKSPSVVGSRMLLNSRASSHSLTSSSSSESCCSTPGAILFPSTYNRGVSGMASRRRSGSASRFASTAAQLEAKLAREANFMESPPPA